MSEIPFVEQLGDAVETMAGTAPGRRRRSRRRLASYAAAGSLVLGGGAVAAASIFFSSEEQATADIQCYQGDSVERSVFQDNAVGRDPVAVCRESLGFNGQYVPPLVACANKDTVAVIAGRTVAGAFDGKAKVVLVRRDVSHTLDKLLLATALRLQRTTGERCYTTAGVTAIATRAIASTHTKPRVVVSSLPEAGEIMDSRGPRYEAGCSVFASLGPEPGFDGLVLNIHRKR